MRSSYIVIISFLFLAVLLYFSFDLAIEFLGFVGVISLLISKSIELLRFQNRLKRADLIYFKKTGWFIGWIYVGTLIFPFTRLEINEWSIGAIISLVIYGVLESFNNVRHVFSINGDGIRDINSNKLIPLKEITQIDFGSEKIIIHTTKGQFALEFFESKLDTPHWNELTTDSKNLIQEYQSKAVSFISMLRFHTQNLMYEADDLMPCNDAAFH